MIFRLRSPRWCHSAKTLFRRDALSGGGIFLLLATSLSANPTGGTVAAGSATIAGQGTSAVTIHQGSNTAIINWQSFSINSGESTSFLQTGANSATLNRVLGGQTSLINGTLSANGRVYLINGNGVIVGPGGVINANAFTASTRDISDADFLSGNLHFTGSSDAGVKNLGSITVLGGNVVLIGRTVDNEGTISAHKGTVGLIAADDVLLAQDNADGSTITVSPALTTPKASSKVGVKNGGTITAVAAELKAANGNIYALAVQNQGLIRATTVSHQGGHIWLTSDSGNVSNSGTLDASATVAGGKGGSVTLKSTTGAVSHTGQIIAQGGQGGVGGNAEISGAQVQFTGTVDLTAPHGTMGNLLIDPTDIDVVTGGGTDLAAATIDPSAIVSALDGANVTLSATNSITVDDVIDSSGNSAAGNLDLDAPILQLNAGVILNGTLSGTATQVSLGPNAIVQNGIDAVASGGMVIFTNGATYALSNEIVINKSIDLEGNGADLNGEEDGRIMEIDGGSVTLNNLMFQDGTALSSLGAAGSGGSEQGNGGALLVYGYGTSPTVTITNDTFFGNLAILGGAIYNLGSGTGSSNLLIENSTFTANVAHFGTVLYLEGDSSGSASIGMKADTIANNSGFEVASGAIYTNTSGGFASVNINDTIIAGNVDTNAAESDYTNGGGGALTEGGYNLYGQNGDPGDFPGAAVGDVLLQTPIFTVVGPLGGYGGLTQTMPLIQGSPALEAGDPAFNGSIAQNGVARGAETQFSGSNADIGAFEAQYVSVQANSAEFVYGSTPVFTYTITNGPSTAVLTGSPELIEPATNAGFYGEDIGPGTLTPSAPYILDFTYGDLTIDQRQVDVLPDSGQSKVYGSPDPVLTYTTAPADATSGLVNGDTLTGSPSYNGAGDEVNVGTYQTNLGTLADSTGNYVIVLDEAAPTFAITPATLYYAADQVMVPVGATYPNFTGTVVGFVPGDTEANSTGGTLIFTTTAPVNAPQGYYEVDGSGLYSSTGNYVFAQAATNIAALVIGNPPPRGETTPAMVTSPTAVDSPTSLDSPNSPAETQSAASQPNTPVSQAIAQSTPPPPAGQVGTSLPGGTSTPLVQTPAPPTVDINVTTISPNESIDSTPAPAGGDSSSSSSTDAVAVAQSSSFNPDVGATRVTTGQSITIGGTPGIPPPPVVQVQLNQILGTGALDTLSTALSSATSTDDSGSSTQTAASTSSTPDQNGQTASTSATAAAASSSAANSSGAPVIAGPTAVVAPGQTVTLAGGRANAGPPPPMIQSAFDAGFSSESRESLAKAAGL